MSRQPVLPLCTVVAAVAVSLTFSLSAAGGAAPSSSLSKAGVDSIDDASLTGGVGSRPVRRAGETFFKATLYQVRWNGSGGVVLSANSDGSGSTLVDDVLTMRIVHADGSAVTYRHDYSNGCSGDHFQQAPVDLTSWFELGANKVTVTLKDTCGGFAGSTGLWLTGFDD
jgi:hypothetical protein